MATFTKVLYVACQMQEIILLVTWEMYSICKKRDTWAALKNVVILEFAMSIVENKIVSFAM